VNARHTKNLPGRKSDVQESQWLLKLHTYGLLNNSFQPTAEIRSVRTYWRQRAEHVHASTPREHALSFSIGRIIVYAHKEVTLCNVVQFSSLSAHCWSPF